MLTIKHFIFMKDHKGKEIAINVNEIRAFYQYTDENGNKTLAVDIGSPNIIFVKKTFLEFQSAVKSALNFKIIKY